MSTVKSFSVGNGDMFYINHNSTNFTIIDCCLSDDNKKTITEEIKKLARANEIIRFISTHPDDDHIAGLKHLDDTLGILNFYCVKNEATKKDATDDFTRYCELRNSEKKAFYLYGGCRRKWMNESDETRDCSGLNVAWPVIKNAEFQNALKSAKAGESPNNISPIITYSIKDGIVMMWMGDLESDFMNKISASFNPPKAHVLFAPHHGRESGKVPENWLKVIDTKIIIIGEAPSNDLNYYPGYNTITQNSAGNITFECKTNKIHVYVSNKNYSVNFLSNENLENTTHGKYLGTLIV